MNNLKSIERHIIEMFPDHHVAVTESAWPYALTFELIGPQTWCAPVIDKLVSITGCQDTQLFCTRGYDDSCNFITTITVRA